MSLSVSELNEQAKTLLELNFADVAVKGEISRLTKNQSSGHWYFTLKDSKASICAAMFRFANQKVKFELKDGMAVVASGKVSIYSPSGSYQLIVNAIRPEGDGELELAFKQLKAKLEAEGLFDHKKPLPSFPKKVAIITSATSAAFADIVRTAQSRGFGCKFYLYNSLMQGDSAAYSVINALKKADTKGYDAIIIARGGGSREDLWCFNDEDLARAIFAAKTPIISAIGHEIDFSISDFVADHRSLTPTAAIVDLLPDSMQLMQYLDMKEAEIRKVLDLKILERNSLLKNLNLTLKSRAVNSKIEINLANLRNFESKFKNLLEHKFSKFDQILRLKGAILEEKKSYYELTKNFVQIQKDSVSVNLASLKIGDNITIYSQDSKKQAIIKG
ncbi:exodeoxyribonuclease VII large subunit [Campylobacter corcagiensis]|uniref:Exodeoxyribonuclease 7 large subunit n=1 Tax=Campylobacter corcagiensis TaxID=1448857 RepID=A0A7M1LGN3_9BACT|nr:exodeoxyribonuclease VII large subunit [Campylobacter corcagiensis]QKF64086.1 exodeoxyribonuclease VII, large subunit [Campylobacter corcagiensis]QOQ87718.1 exodeoxyribonuclease VII large subunit [Campylobacter corcagiensis]